MKFTLPLLLVATFLIIAGVTFADVVTVNNFGNFWWNDSVTVMGNATYTNGTAIKSERVNVTSTKINCANTTDTSGQYFCTFRTPLEIGTYNLTVNVTNSTGTSNYNYTTLTVKPKYGENVIGTTGRIVYEIPFVIQEPSGRIRVVVIRVTAWRR